MQGASDRQWWDEFFDDTYADIGLVPGDDTAEAARQTVVDQIVDKLRLNPGDLVLDQCCGVGRLSIPLAARGFRVIGVDVTQRYIERARADADRRGIACELYAADAFEFRAPQPCDAAFNWFTSFGYHRDDRVNRRMLDRAFESLRPGGSFALDFVSLPRVLREFREARVSRHRLPSGGEVLLIQEPCVDFRAGMIGGQWTFIHDDGRREVRTVENRAYMPVDLVALFEQTGFTSIELCGGEGEPFGRMSRRCVVVGQKPG